jgi:hypothetical protein
MNWTLSKPTVSGYYWNLWRKGEKPEMLRVDCEKGEVFEMLWDGSRELETVHGFWCGPLQFSELPKFIYTYRIKDCHACHDRIVTQSPIFMGIDCTACDQDYERWSRMETERKNK